MTFPDLAGVVREAAPEDLPALAGQLREAELLAEMRLRAAFKGGGASTRAAKEEASMLTYQDAAKFLSCSVSYVETMVRQGKIPHVKLPAADKAGRFRDGRLVRLLVSDLRAFAEEHRT